MERQRRQRREHVQATRRIIRRRAGSREALGASWKEDTVKEERRSRRKVLDEGGKQKNVEMRLEDSSLQWKSKGTTQER